MLATSHGAGGNLELLHGTIVFADHRPLARRIRRTTSQIGTTTAAPKSR